MVGQITTVFALTQGAKVDVPDPDDARTRLDEWLVSPLEPITLAGKVGHQAELEAALGLS